MTRSQRISLAKRYKQSLELYKLLIALDNPTDQEVKTACLYYAWLREVGELLNVSQPLKPN